jgi:hypothetical protein
LPQPQGGQTYSFFAASCCGATALDEGMAKAEQNTTDTMINDAVKQVLIFMTISL